MAKKYGLTPWGAALLEVIESKTDYGRLSRGKTYANTGKVTSVTVQDSHIKAKVKGNYNPYYHTSMDFTPFSSEEIATIQSILNKHPILLASIMNGELPKVFLEYLYENGIALFEDFKMSCNCPDFWGEYACKHISGLYYIAVSEIDKNPFIIFALRGFDLVKHYGIEREIEIGHPLKLGFSRSVEVALEAPEIIKLRDNAPFILSMLSSDPPFAPIDYKEVMEEFYKKVPKALVQNISPIYSDKLEKIERLFQDADIKLMLSERVYESEFYVMNPLIGASEELF